MIREAALFVMAEQVLVEVLGRIRAEHWDIVMPPLFDMPGADQRLAWSESGSGGIRTPGSLGASLVSRSAAFKMV